MIVKRGPKPGWKASRLLAAYPSDQDPSPAEVVQAPLSAADRENPGKLSGPALRDLAHRRGIARSELAKMGDEKIRAQLRYVTYRQYEAA